MKLRIKEDAYPADWRPSRDNIDRVFSCLDQSDSKNPDFLKDSYGFSTYKVMYCDEKEDCISLQVAMDNGDYRFDETFYVYPDTKKDTYKIRTDELGERTVGNTTDVWDIISTCLRKQGKQDTKESIQTRRLKESVNGMKTFGGAFKVWQNDDGEFCIYFPSTGRLYFGFSYTSNVHEVSLIIGCDDHYDAELFASICLGEGSEEDFEFAEQNYDEYLAAVESGELYDFLLDYFSDYTIAEEPDAETAFNFLVTDALA